jgi:hypothetical protein
MLYSLTHSLDCWSASQEPGDTGGYSPRCRNRVAVWRPKSGRSDTRFRHRHGLRTAAGHATTGTSSDHRWTLTLDTGVGGNRHYDWIRDNGSLLDRVRTFLASHR